MGHEVVVKWTCNECGKIEETDQYHAPDGWYRIINYGDFPGGERHAAFCCGLHLVIWLETPKEVADD